MRVVGFIYFFFSGSVLLFSTRRVRSHSDMMPLVENYRTGGGQGEGVLHTSLKLTAHRFQISAFNGGADTKEV